MSAAAVQVIGSGRVVNTRISTSSLKSGRIPVFSLRVPLVPAADLEHHQPHMNSTCRRWTMARHRLLPTLLVAFAVAAVVPLVLSPHVRAQAPAAQSPARGRAGGAV